MYCITHVVNQRLIINNIQNKFRPFLCRIYVVFVHPLRKPSTCCVLVYSQQPQPIYLLMLLSGNVKGGKVEVCVLHTAATSQRPQQHPSSFFLQQHHRPDASPSSSSCTSSAATIVTAAAARIAPPQVDWASVCSPPPPPRACCSPATRSTPSSSAGPSVLLLPVNVGPVQEILSADPRSSTSSLLPAARSSVGERAPTGKCTTTPGSERERGAHR